MSTKTKVPEPHVSALYRINFVGMGFGRDWLEEIGGRLGPGENVLLTTTARTEFVSQSHQGFRLRQPPPARYRGILAITDKRVILFAKRPLHGFVMHDYPYDTITMVEEMRGWTTSGIRLHAASAVRDLDMMPKDDVERAASLIRDQVNQLRSRENAGASTRPSQGDAALDALKLRLARGEITPEEFEKLRKLLM